MKNNIQKETKPQPKPLTPEQLQSIKGGSGGTVINDLML